MKDEKDALDDSYEKWGCVKAWEDIKHLNVCRWNQYLDTSALADGGLFKKFSSFLSFETQTFPIL